MTQFFKKIRFLMRLYRRPRIVTQSGTTVFSPEKCGDIKLVISNGGGGGGSDMSNISRAKDFAKKHHAGQKDDDGIDYFDAHLEHVASILRGAKASDDLICAAYLHDILEDTDVTLDELTAKFGDKIANLVHEVTHEGSKDQYGYYFPRLKSRDAIVLKLADRMSNLLRMDNWPKDRQEQYLRKTKFWKDGK